LLEVGDIAPQAIIDGKGNCEVKGSSPRLYIDALNTNVEFSADMLVDGSAKEVYLVVRSNHETRPSGFGGYYAYFNFEDKLMYFKKEQTHEIGYSARMNETPITFEKGRWYHATMSATNVPNSDNVSLHATFNGKEKEIWGLDSGNIKCGNMENTPPYRAEGKWCFIRTNAPDNVMLRNAGATTTTKTKKQ
jgi:hypothetical protein